MGGKNAERCPRCGNKVPVVKTYTVRAMPDEAYRKIPLRVIRYQQLRCTVCGSTGDRVVLEGQTQWDGTEQDRPETVEERP